MFNTRRSETNESGVTQVFSGDKRRADFVTSKRDTGWYFPESLHSIPVLEAPEGELELDADLLYEAVSQGLAKVALDEAQKIDSETSEI